MTSARTLIEDEFSRAEMLALLRERPKVWIATIDHKNGTIVFAKRTERELYRLLADHAQSWWHEVALEDEDDPRPDDPDELVRAYFGRHPEEFLEVHDVEMKGGLGSMVWIALLNMPPYRWPEPPNRFIVVGATKDQLDDNINAFCFSTGHKKQNMRLHIQLSTL